MLVRHAATENTLDLANIRLPDKVIIAITTRLTIKVILVVYLIQLNDIKEPNDFILIIQRH